MPDQKESGPVRTPEDIWQDIKSTHIFAGRENHNKRPYYDSVPVRSFQDRFYWLLRSIALPIERLQNSGNRILTPEHFRNIVEEMSPHSTYVDHMTINVDENRLEDAAGIILSEPGFSVIDYFLPLDDSTGMISLVVGDARRRIYIAVNEGLNGWTNKTAVRIQDFQKLLTQLFKDEPDIKIPEMTFDTINGKVFLEITSRNSDGTRNENLFAFDDSSFDLSHITAFVRDFGENIQHVALETDRIIPRSEFVSESLPDQKGFVSTAETLYKRIAEGNFLPLESQEVYRGNAGKRPEDVQEVFQFFTKALCNGFFFEFINRKSVSGTEPRQGLFVTGTVLKLYKDKERERKGE